MEFVALIIRQIKQSEKNILKYVWVWTVLVHTHKARTEHLDTFQLMQVQPKLITQCVRAVLGRCTAEVVVEQVESVKELEAEKQIS